MVFITPRVYHIMNTFVAVIPTTLQRPELLERSLKSVFAQTTQPNLVVICCDCSHQKALEFQKHIETNLDVLAFDGEIVVVKNHRTPGLSGNLNSGFERLEACDPKTTIVSLLDDDDYWNPNYLAAVEKQFSKGCQFAAATFKYLNEDDKLKKPRIPPTEISQQQFFEGNPGISNSTMSISLEKLHDMQGWNEDLPSCTDRDACLRLIKVSAKYGVAKDAVSYIDREHGYSRLTSRGGKVKFQGLEVFYRQWRREMSNDSYEISRARSWRLFNYDPGQSAAPLSLAEATQTSNHLVVAVISVNPKILSRLLKSLDEVATVQFRVTVIALRNNPSVDWPLPAPSQLEQLYFDTSSDEKVLKIAEARNELQNKLRAYLKRTETEPLVWLLDDDFICRQDDIHKLCEIGNSDQSGVDAIIGGYEGDSPNAAFSGLLYELTDLELNLRWLETLPPKAPLPDRSSENDVLQLNFPDTYHYALSLKAKPSAEQSAWLEPVSSDETVSEARLRLLRDLAGILTGTSIFRPLRRRLVSSEISLLGPSVTRGGNIIILNHEMLDVPYPQIRGTNGPIRRSDMMWALLAKIDRGFNLQKSNIFTRHRRDQVTLTELGLEKTTDELLGSCVFNSLKSYHEQAKTGGFEQILGERAEKTMLILQRYFAELDQALEQLQSLDIPEVSTLVSKLTRILDANFRNGIMTVLKELTLPSRASDIKMQFDQHLLESDQGVEICDLIRGGNKFKISTHFDDNIQLVQLGDISSHPRPLIRVHSSCLFSEVFRATDCDCGSQLDAALIQISHYGCGAVIYIQQEGRGHGLRQKIQIIKCMQDQKLDTYQACERLGLSTDVRSYDSSVTLLRQMGVNAFRLLTNNPIKADTFLEEGFDVEVCAVRGDVTWNNQDYLLSKARSSHRGLLLSAKDLDLFSGTTEGQVLFESTNGPWGEFSNFSRHAVFQDGVIWPTSEHLYQAKKFMAKNIKTEIRNSSTPSDAKKIARLRQGEISPNWDDVKLTAMYSVVNLKLRQNPEILKRLLDTGQREIIEISKDDTYWGLLKTGEGQNYLGKILMLIRAQQSQAE